MTERTARNFLLYQLQNVLYSEFYIRGHASPRVWKDESASGHEPDFVERLSAADTGNGCLEPGWLVIARGGNEVVVSKHGVTLYVSPDGVEPMPSGVSPGRQCNYACLRNCALCLRAITWP
jgi:hypothetical protein